MSKKPNWVEGVPLAITVTSADGTILEMNPTSCATFAADGGAELVGKNVFDCHSPESQEKLTELYQTARPNHYTIRKSGQKKMIHQVPWLKDGKFAGFVELSVPIPDKLPHFDRD